MRETNFTILGKAICRLSTLEDFVSDFTYFDAFINAVGSNSSGVKNQAKFRTLIMHGTVREISGSVRERFKL